MSTPVPQDTLNWFRDHASPDSSIVYVDSAICSGKLTAGGQRGFRLGGGSGRDFCALVESIRSALQVPSDFDRLDKYMEVKGPGGRLCADRMLQRRIATLIAKHVGEGRKPYFEGVGDLVSDDKFLEQLADQPGCKAIVVVDGMFVTLAAAPEVIKGQLRVPGVQRQRTFRTLEGVLTPEPAASMTVGDPALPLLMDRRAYANWSDGFTAVTSVGWYPFVRVMGIYQTTDGGQPYLDVLALMFSPWLTGFRIFGANGGSSGGSGLQEVLKGILDGTYKTVKDSIDNDPNRKVNLVEYRAMLLPIQLLGVFQELCQVTKDMARTLPIELQTTLGEYRDALNFVGQHLDAQCLGIHVPPMSGMTLIP